MEGHWEELKVDNDYEIFSEYPYSIKRKGKDKLISEFISNGYIRCNISGKMYLKHRLIAFQWIPNPNNYKQIDHINKNPAENRIENLRWCNQSINNRNKSSNNGVKYEYFDELEHKFDLIEVEEYGNYKFEDYYFDPIDNEFYYFNGKQYRKLFILEAKM